MPQLPTTLLLQPLDVIRTKMQGDAARGLHR